MLVFCIVDVTCKNTQNLQFVMDILFDDKREMGYEIWFNNGLKTLPKPFTFPRKLQHALHSRRHSVGILRGRRSS